MIVIKETRIPSSGGDSVGAAKQQTPAKIMSTFEQLSAARAGKNKKDSAKNVHGNTRTSNITGLAERPSILSRKCPWRLFDVVLHVHEQ